MSETVIDTGSTDLLCTVSAGVAIALDLLPRAPVPSRTLVTLDP